MAKRKQVFAAYAEYVKAVREEPGTLCWEMSTDAADEAVLWFFAK